MHSRLLSNIALVKQCEVILRVYEGSVTVPENNYMQAEVKLLNRS